MTGVVGGGVRSSMAMTDPWTAGSSPFACSVRTSCFSAARSLFGPIKTPEGQQARGQQHSGSSLRMPLVGSLFLKP